MKIWKRNAIIASVLLLVCAGVYLNWSKAQKTDVQDLSLIHISEPTRPY